jgi:hypothetical protein
MISNLKLLPFAFVIALAACGPKNKPAMVADPSANPDSASDADGGTLSPSEESAGGALAEGGEKGEKTAGGEGAVAAKGDEEGAKALLAQFVAPNADHAALTRSLRPTSGDYKSMFDAATAGKIEAGQAKEWNSNTAAIKPKPKQTEIKVWGATGADLAAGKGAANEFPPGYKKIAKHLAPEVTFFRFKFVEPGKDVGTAYDGLAFVNGHWVISSQPWRALDAKGGPEPAEKEKKGGKPKGKGKKK